MNVGEMYSKGKELLQKNFCIAIPPIIASISVSVIYYSFAKQASPTMPLPGLLFLTLTLPFLGNNFYRTLPSNFFRKKVVQKT